MHSMSPICNVYLGANTRVCVCCRAKSEAISRVRNVVQSLWPRAQVYFLQELEPNNY